MYSFCKASGQDGNLNNKQTEHIAKKITQLKWPKYEKTKLRKWNEPNNNRGNFRLHSYKQAWIAKPFECIYLILSFRKTVIN